MFQKIAPTFLFSIVFLLSTSSLFAALPNGGHFRWYNDDGTIVSATAAAAEDTNIQMTSGDIKRLRLELYDTNPQTSGGFSNVFPHLSFRADGGGWTILETDSSPVKNGNSTNLINGQSTGSDLLTNTALSSAPGRVFNNTDDFLFEWDAGTETNREFEFTIEYTGGLAAGTLIEFQLTSFDQDRLPGFTVGGALPVELISFYGKTENQKVNLFWSTAAEINNDYFIIERFAANRKTWSEIGKIGGNGTSSEVNAYQYEDENPVVGLNYYRLKQVDMDGTENFSKMINVDVAPSQSYFELAPNPASDRIKLKYFSSDNQPAQINLFNMSGQLVKSLSVEMNKGVNIYNFDLSSFPSGMYQASLIAGQQQFNQKLVIR